MNQTQSPAALRKEQPFSTGNAILAFCLRIAGVPFHNPAKPCFNLYDAEGLKRMGFSGKLEDAVNEAVSREKKGRVEYQFRRVKGIGKLCEAFAEQEREIEAEGVEIDVADFMRGIMEKLNSGQMSQPEGLLRIACVNLKLRGAFMNAWKKMVPMVQIPNPGEATTRQTGNGCHVVSHPGYRIVSLNASEATRRKLGV